jgi:hypothetical protein
MEVDQLQIRLKHKLGAKKAGLHFQDNVELEGKPENALPEGQPNRIRQSWANPL